MREKREGEECTSPLCCCHGGKAGASHDHGASAILERGGSEEEQVLREELLFELAQLYKVFGDETRLRILSALMDGEQGVGALAGRLEMTLSAVSHSLRVLKSARLVKCRREGKSVYYALCDEHVKKILEMGLDHVAE